MRSSLQILDTTQQIYKELHRNNVKPVIAINGKGFYKSAASKDPEYGKRLVVEIVFSKLKEVFGLSKNRFVGIEKVATHIYSCLIASKLLCEPLFSFVVLLLCEIFSYFRIGLVVGSIYPFLVFLFEAVA